MSEDARVERKKTAGKFIFRTKKNNVLSETGATYYLSKYSKYMYINIYKRARVRGHGRYARTCVLDTCVHTCVRRTRTRRSMSILCEIRRSERG